MIADIVWPSYALAPARGRVSIVCANTGGGPSMNGLEQIVASDAGYFALSMLDIHMLTNGQMQLWNQLEAVLGGRAGTALVPALDGRRAPWPDGVTSYGAIPHGDGALFSDGTGYTQPVIDIVTNAAIAEGATTAELLVNLAGDLIGGMHFSYGERLFRIKNVVDVTGDVWTVSLAFPAREAVPAGVRLEFDEPYFRARLATDTEMAIDILPGEQVSVHWTEDV